MSTTTTAPIALEEIELQKMTIAALLDYAKINYELVLPKSWTKSEIIQTIQLAQSNEDPDALSSWRKPGINTAEAVPAKPVLTKEEVQAKLVVHKEKIDAAEAARIAAEASKPKKVAQATVDQLIRYSDELGYAIGAMRWAMGRIAKVEKVFPELLDGLGELVDAESASLANESLVGGYRRAHKQMRFYSPAFETIIVQTELPAALSAEIASYRPENPVSQLSVAFGDVPAEPDFDEEVDTEDDEPTPSL